jgi:hypothetical protein
MRTCVGWFSSPVCALIYQVAKYVAMCSTKGYAIGRKFLEWIEARLADVDDQSELLGNSEDVLAICGSRMYVFFLDAAPPLLLSSSPATYLLTYASSMQPPRDGRLCRTMSCEVARGSYYYLTYAYMHRSMRLHSSHLTYAPI